MKSVLQPSPTGKRMGPESLPHAAEPWSVEELTQILSTKTFGPKDPVLKINVTDIKDRLARYRDVRHQDEPPAKQARTSKIRATCALTIWEASSTKQPTIVEQTRKCEIHGKSLPSGERGASIEMEKPFSVRLDQLQTEKRVSQHLSPEIQFSMQIAILVANEQDTWPPVQIKIPEAKTAAYWDADGLIRFPLLCAKWHKLPRCPQTDQESILEMVASQDNNTYRPKLGLRIDASWCAAPTPLETANDVRRTRLPKLSPSPELKTPKLDVTIEWTFEGLIDSLPELTYSGFHCPFCGGRNFQEPIQLHFHLINSHPHFKHIFTYELCRKGGRSALQGTVRVDIADDYDSGSKYASGFDRHEMNIDWIKPKWPLDLEAYLKGDESWLQEGKETKRKRNLLVTRAPPMPSAQRSRSHDAKHDIPLSAVTRDADEVPDLPRRKKRKFPVPAPPNSDTVFFRLTTKRPLVQDEMVSESDDDIDEEWILQKHVDTIDSFTDTTREEKEFIKRFDRHMLSEDTSSDLHASEALIRFCRINRAWLRTRSMRFEFHKKLATLKIQGCITRKTIWECMKIIDGTDASSTNPNIDAMDIDTPAQTPAQQKTALAPMPDATESGDLYGRCAVCTANITHPRAQIFCANAACTRPEFHLSCVGLKKREQGWLCPTCRVGTPPHDSPSPLQTFHDAPTSPEKGREKQIPTREKESGGQEIVMMSDDGDIGDSDMVGGVRSTRSGTKLGEGVGGSSGKAKGKGKAKANATRGEVTATDESWSVEKAFPILYRIAKDR